MIAELATGYSSLKTAVEVVKGLNAVATQAKINETKIELQSLILDAQSALSAARDADATSSERIRSLEQKIVELKNWEADKQRYQLKDVGPGAFAYVLKAGMENGEPPHWICANCYQDGEKKILQVMPQGAARTAMDLRTQYECPKCKSKNHALALLVAMRIPPTWVFGLAFPSAYAASAACSASAATPRPSSLDRRL